MLSPHKTTNQRSWLGFTKAASLLCHWPWPTVTIYTKTGCRLCEHVNDVLQRCRQHTAFDIAYVDIAGDAELTARYGQVIPVILLDGVEIARHFLREQHLLSLLRRNPS